MKQVRAYHRAVSQHLIDAMAAEIASVRAGNRAHARLQRLERIGDAIEALIPLAAVLVAALLFVAMVLR
jgi:hypothetical protein